MRQTATSTSYSTGHVRMAVLGMQTHVGTPLLAATSTPYSAGHVRTAVLGTKKRVRRLQKAATPHIAVGCLWNEDMCWHVAGGGNLHVLQWAWEHGCPWDDHTSCAKAAESGFLHVLQWARENDCPWHDLTCSSATFGGHLQWARENGCPWTELSLGCTHTHARRLQKVATSTSCSGGHERRTGVLGIRYNRPSLE